MKKTWFFSIVIILSLFGSSQFAIGKEQDFPNRAIGVIVPPEMGGILDMATRIVADQLSKELKVPVVVINKPGAAGVRGTDLAAKSKADGYTILAGMLGPLVLVYFSVDNVPYNTQKDFLPLAYVGESPSLLVVKSSLPYKTFKEMITYAKANPGKLSFGATLLASTSALNMDVIKKREGIDITTVVYSGGGPAMVAALGGHVNMTSIGYSALKPHIMAGTLRPLATSMKIDELPDVPTYRELGFPEILVNWMAFFAPAKIPRDVYKRLIGAFNKVLANPETAGKLKKAGYVSVRKTPTEISELLKNQYNLISEITKGKKLGE